MLGQVVNELKPQFQMANVMPYFCQLSQRGLLILKDILGL